MTGDVEVAVLTAAFTARPDREADLAAVLARYVVLTRGEPGCRNVDLLISATESGRFLVIEKWDSPDAARAHLDTELMTAHGRGRRPAPRREAQDGPARSRRTISAQDSTTTAGGPCECDRKTYFWRRMSTGTFEGPRSAAPVSLQISRMPA